MNGLHPNKPIGNWKYKLKMNLKHLAHFKRAQNTYVDL
jgi:hypothetical protein